MKILLSIVLTALIVGGGTYYVLHTRESTNTNTLQTTINALNGNLAALQHQVTNSSTTNVNTNVTTNTNSATTIAACTSANLSATLTNGSGTAGTYYYTLGLKNTGAAPCTYTGSTKVSLLSAQSSTLGSVASVTADTLTIAAGQSIYAAVGFPNASNYGNSSTCTIGVTTLSVLPPSQTTAVTVAHLDTLYPGWTNYACPGFSVQAFSTTAPS